MVCVLSTAGDHVPAIPSFDEPGSVIVAPLHTGPNGSKVGVICGVIDIVVEQVEEFPHASVTVHAIVETPGLKEPLASLPVPLPLVAPVIWKVMINVALQSSEAITNGIW